MKGRNILEVNGTYYVLIPNEGMTEWYGEKNIEEILQYQRDFVSKIKNDLIEISKDPSVQTYMIHKDRIIAHQLSIKSPINQEDYHVAKPNESLLKSIQIARNLLLTNPKVREYERTLEQYFLEIDVIYSIEDVKEEIHKLNKKKVLKK